MTPPEAVTAAWAACEERWDDAAAHDAFFALAAQYDCFAYAASKYKPRAGDAVADRALDRIRKAAVAKMMASSTAHVDPHKSKPYRATLALVVLLLVAAIAGLAYVANMRHRPPASTPASH